MGNARNECLYRSGRHPPSQLTVTPSIMSRANRSGLPFFCSRCSLFVFCILVSMRIKKFRCIQCGGPKVNPYTTPYIMCDFCGSFTDIDFAVGMETWTQDQGTTLNYQARKMDLMEKSQAAVALGNREKYCEFQREFWDFYYRAFPAYLPPTISTQEKYALYLEVCVASSLENAFDPKWQQYVLHQQQLQGALKYVQMNGKTTVEI